MGQYEQPSVNINFPYYNVTVTWPSGSSTQEFTIPVGSNFDGWPFSGGITTAQEFFDKLKAMLLAELPAGSTVEVHEVKRESTQIIAP